LKEGNGVSYWVAFLFYYQQLPCKQRSAAILNRVAVFVSLLRTSPGTSGHFVQRCAAVVPAADPRLAPFDFEHYPKKSNGGYIMTTINLRDFKFDTSTPMGRAMLNICIVFAQLERETIQKRVTDAYYSRCQKGFHMSGKAPYGYKLEPTVVEGIRTKMMVAEPDTAEHVRLMFEMYSDPQTSFGDIARYFSEQGIPINGKALARGFVSQLLRNPAYAQADLELYDFFKAQGAAIVNDAADFTGKNGCYLYQGRDVAENKRQTLKDHILVIAPHEGLISSDVWLQCRKKLMNNTTFQNGRKAQNTWLAGKIKCGRCGYALVSVNSSGIRYLRCHKRVDNIESCEGCGTLRTDEFEQSIYTQMIVKWLSFKR